MRILDNERDKALEDVLVLLTRKEATILKSIVEQMLTEKEQSHHHFLDLENFSREIVFGLYDELNIEKNTYMPRVMELIRADE